MLALKVEEYEGRIFLKNKKSNVFFFFSTSTETVTGNFQCPCPGTSETL
jgi:hypothetical protein